MTAVREQYTNIVGVDTHARTNTYAILVAATGQVMDTATFPTSPPGLKRAIAWIDRRSEPGKTLVAIEGTNSYGSGLTRALRATELDLCEVRPPRRASRAGRGKSDDIDALAAARTVLGEQVEALLEPRAEGNREALRILLNARNAMERQDTADRLMLTSLLRTMDLGVDARHALTDEQVLLVSRWRARRGEDLSIAIARAEAKRLATAILQFQAQLAANHRQLQDSCWPDGGRPAGPARRRARVRGPGAHLLFAPRAGAFGGRLRRAGRGEPHPRIVRQHDPAPAQPPRRPTAEPGPAYDRPIPNDLRPHNHRIRRTADLRRKDPSRRSAAASNDSSPANSSEGYKPS